MVEVVGACIVERGRSVARFDALGGAAKFVIEVTNTKNFRKSLVGRPTPHSRDTGERGQSRTIYMYGSTVLLRI